MTEVASMARQAAEAQAAAEFEAAELRAQAIQLERKCKEQSRFIDYLKSQLASKGISVAGGVNLPPRSSISVQRRHTMPLSTQRLLLESFHPEQSSTNSLMQKDSHNEEMKRSRSEQGMESSPSGSNGKEVDINAVSRALATLILLRNANSHRALLPSSHRRSDTESSEHALVSVADDGSSGVAATAAAAVSVALAQSWAAVAGGKSTIESSLDHSRTKDLSGHRARFKLVAAVPRNLRSHRNHVEHSSPSPGKTSTCSTPRKYLDRANGKRENEIYSDIGSEFHTDPFSSDIQPSSVGMKTSSSRQSLFREGDAGMALESLDDAHVLDDKQEATWRASGSHLKLQWLSAPTTVFLVFKPSCEIFDVLGKALLWLVGHDLVVYVEPDGYQEAEKALVSCFEATSKSNTEPVDDRTGRSNLSRTSNAQQNHQDTNPIENYKKLLLSWDKNETGCADGIPDQISQSFDLVITLGGDGTVLWACSLFGRKAVPPVIPLAMGSLGFMTPFPINRMEAVLARVTSVAAGFPLMLRHRLQCHIVRDGDTDCDRPLDLDLTGTTCQEDILVLNEIVIDRGMTASLANLQCFVDKNFATSIQGDGLIVATPTGSTAYNLAAGGSMVHPSVPCILFTPICPHSLSSRPVVFPEHVTLCVRVPSDSRSEAYCSFDGRTRRALYPGDSVVIQLSQRPIPMVCNRDSTHDWFLSVREGLHWNKRVVQKAMVKKVAATADCSDGE